MINKKISPKNLKPKRSYAISKKTGDMKVEMVDRDKKGRLLPKAKKKLTK